MKYSTQTSLMEQHSYDFKKGEETTLDIHEKAASKEDIAELINSDFSEIDIEKVNGLPPSNNKIGDVIYNTFGYSSKVYYKNIEIFIDTFSKKGDLVLDPMCGSGSTAIAALRKGRKCIISEGSKAAYFIAKSYVIPVNLTKLKEEFIHLKARVEERINNLYKIRCTCVHNGEECSNFGITQWVMQSDIYKCPKCEEELILYGNETGEKYTYKCPNCSFVLNLRNEKHKIYLLEKRRPIEAGYICPNCICKKKLHKKFVELSDIISWESSLKEDCFKNLWFPTTKIVHNRAYPRKGGWPGIRIEAPVSELFTPRNLTALSFLFNEISKIENRNERELLKFCFLSSLIRSSKRVYKTSVVKNFYQIPAIGKEQNIFYNFERKFKTLVEAKEKLNSSYAFSNITQHFRIFRCDAWNLPLQDEIVDYVFTDPPHGGAIPYYELNLFFSSWLGEEEDLNNEIIIPMDYDAKNEYVKKWGKQLEQVFKEVDRVLKPNRYCTIFFQSKSEMLWNELENVILDRVGFEFIDKCSILKGTTFHTNRKDNAWLMDSFITYKKVK